jgi:chemotaxis protein CheX
MLRDERKRMANDVSVEIVTQIVESIFTTMMDLEVSVSNAQWLPEGDRLTSSVQLEGDWSGVVALECNREQACRFAGQLLSVNPPSTVDDDVRDALGELANMIGGNLKSTLATHARLSMPSVIDGSSQEFLACGSDSQDKIGFTFRGGNFWITVLARNGPTTS